MGFKQIKSELEEMHSFWQDYTVGYCLVSDIEGEIEKLMELYDFLAPDFASELENLILDALEAEQKSRETQQEPFDHEL